MKFMVRMAVLFYATMILFLGVFILLFSLNLLPLQDIIASLEVLYYDSQMRLILGGIAGGILLLNYMYLRLLSGDQERGKMIAFDNPSGRVTVSLLALEDLIRRVIARAPGVKEVRSSIMAGRKGLEIRARIVLNRDVNIPEMTSQLQELVKRKVQDTIGIEETIIVKIHVVKIIPDMKANKKDKTANEEDDTSDSHVPFQGYRA